MGILDTTDTSNSQKTEEQSAIDLLLKNTSTATSQQTGTKGARTSSTLDATTQAQFAGGIDNILERLKHPAPAIEDSRAVVQGQSDTLDRLRSNALNSKLDINTIVDSAKAKAVQDFDEKEGASIAQFQQGVGSTANTASQLMAQRGQRELATNLAALDANLRLEAKEVERQDLATASAAGSQQAGDYLNINKQNLARVAGLSGAATNLGGVLKGATTVEQAEQVNVDNRINKQTEGSLELKALLSEIEASGETTNGKGILDLLDSLSNFMPKGPA